MSHLDRFAAAAQRRVHSGYYDGAVAPRPGESLREALSGGGVAVVAEVKPASPTAGALREGVDAAKLAEAYVAAGARGVSVLTEPDHFHGSLENLAAAGEAGAPTLLKDFVVSPRQLDAAARRGASAALLILDVVEGDHSAFGSVDDAVAACHARGLEALLEVYDAPGYARALQTEADLIGINNRDLRTLEVDLDRTARVLAAGGKDRPVVALSGVASAADARRQLDGGADALLVGTALMRAPDPAAALRELIAC